VTACSLVNISVCLKLKTAFFDSLSNDTTMYSIYASACFTFALLRFCSQLGSLAFRWPPSHTLL
jgi:hypothetical protein